MSYWIFVVTSHEEHGITGEDVLRQRTQDRFWGLGERTPNRKNLNGGDSIAFYLGTPVRAFVGTAALAGPSYQLSKQESEELSHGNEFYRSQHGVRLERSISGPNDAQSSRCCQVLDLSRTRRAGVHISKVACEASLSRTFA